VRLTIIASVLLVLAAGLLSACGQSGQSKADKAHDQVCAARDDIAKQVKSLQELTLTTATTGKVQDSVQAIQSDLNTIASATGDLAQDRKKDVQTASAEFTAKMDQIRVDFGNKLSIQDAATQAKAALKHLAESYRSTFGQLDCS
jgi:phosphoglycerate-specific signal transduction histidine kinase